jgi:hypothetical protein
MRAWSEDQWFTDTLMPRLQQGVEGGFPTPPQESALEVDNLQP